MSNLSSLYEKLHTASVTLLLQRIKDGSATASDLGVARQLLKDNGIDIHAGTRKSPIHALADALPFAIDDDQATG